MFSHCSDIKSQPQPRTLHGSACWRKTPHHEAPQCLLSLTSGHLASPQCGIAPTHLPLATSCLVRASQEHQILFYFILDQIPLLPACIASGCCREESLPALPNCNFTWSPVHVAGVCVGGGVWCDLQCMSGVPVLKATRSKSCNVTRAASKGLIGRLG